MLADPMRDFVNAVYSFASAMPKAQLLRRAATVFVGSGSEETLKVRVGSGGKLYRPVPPAVSVTTAVFQTVEVLGLRWLGVEEALGTKIVSVDWATS